MQIVMDPFLRDLHTSAVACHIISKAEKLNPGGSLETDCYQQTLILYSKYQFEKEAWHLFGHFSSSSLQVFVLNGSLSALRHCQHDDYWSSH